MNILNTKVRQGGKSAIGNIIVLGLIGFGVWIGIQFIPQKLEQGTVRSILDAVQQRHNAVPIQDSNDLWQVIDKQILVNEVRDMKQNFDVTQSGGGYTVRVSYDRDLNLIFTTKVMNFNESIHLN